MDGPLNRGAIAAAQPRQPDRGL